MLFKPSHAPTNPLMRLAKGAVGCTAFIAAMLLAIQASAAQISLTWNASSTTSVTGYNLYARASSGSYTTANNVGNTLSYTVSTLPSGAAIAAGQTYCFAVTAYNAARTESSPSNEVCGAAPAATSGSTTPGSTSGTSGTSLATLWPNSAIPANVAVGDSTALTVGVKFTSTT
ncbi:MAG: fibronectin type III domain-containing protein, partial [Rhodocyclaceae bacterium]